MGSGLRLVCLLPVRNAKEDLPGYLESAARVADAVVALDDGSTDGSRDVLEASPLVRILLSNPRRESFAGWDDGANRNRLLGAAAALEPEWIVSLDADERIDPDDAAALLDFLEGDALRGCAYGLQHFRMWDNGRYDPDGKWIYRLFAWEPGQSFPDRRLHFDPVPTSIPRRAWVRTTIRVRHLAAADDDRRLARLAKYREADPEGEYPTDFGGLDARPEGPLPEWEPRPPGLAIIVGPEDAIGARDRGSAEEAVPVPLPGRPDGPCKLVCLLPARNCEEDLPGYFESAARFADAVVALDDGSTDGTRGILASEPLVRVLLARSPRADYAGWDDGANRNLLLRAAADLEPEWIVSLDADERIAPDDAAALRRFVDRDAMPGFAYGFRVFRMVGDAGHYDRADLWVYRLFAHGPGQSFPEERLHFVPVPRSIPRTRWVPTTVRIQHLASMTEERRRARFDKYLQADPDRTFQADYSNLLEPPGPVRRWEPRPPGLPVHPGGPGAGRTAPEALDLRDLETDEIDLDVPILSAIVISRDDEDRIERVVRSVVDQECDEPFEVIVVTSGTDRTAEIVRELFPDLTLVELSRPASPGEARNAGLAVARGDYVSFPGSHVMLPQGSLAARIRAHELGYPMVTGTTLNGTFTRSGWASYFLDHSTVLPGRPSEELQAPPAHCSYDRELLLGVGGFPEDMRAGEDTVANVRLAQLGCRAYRAADITLVHESPCRDPLRLVRHHFVRGRALGRILLAGGEPGGRVLNRRVVRRVLLGYLPRRLSATAANVRRWGGDSRPVYREALPLVVAGAAAAWGGTWFELFRPARGKLRALVGTPGVNVVVAGLDRRPGYPVGRTDLLLLARIDLLRARARVVSLPRDLLVDIPGRGPGRLNEAYYLGASNDAGRRAAGMALLRRTLEVNLGIATHGEVVVDFEGFRRVVDSMGGLLVDVPGEIHDEFVGEDGEPFSAHFRPGPQRLDGERALLYARTRKADGEIRRRLRHGDLAVALVAQAGRLRSPARLARALGAARGSVHVRLGVGRALAVAQSLIRLRPSGVRAAHVGPPLVRSEQTAEGRWIQRGDPATIGAFVRDRLGAPGPGSAGGARVPPALR